MKFGKIILLSVFSTLCMFAVADHAKAEKSADAIVLYGHTLDPMAVTVDSPVHPWSKLKGFVPELLPGAAKGSKTPAEFCDHINLLEALYKIEKEGSEQFVVDELERVYPNKSPFKEGSVSYNVSEAFGTHSSGQMRELLDLMPGYEERIVVVQDIVLKHQAMMYLHDAAFSVCPKHAKAQGYVTVLSHAWVYEE